MPRSAQASPASGPRSLLYRASAFYIVVRAGGGLTSYGAIATHTQALRANSLPVSTCHGGMTSDP